MNTTFLVPATQQVTDFYFTVRNIIDLNAPVGHAFLKLKSLRISKDQAFSIVAKRTEEHPEKVHLFVLESPVDTGFTPMCRGVLQKNNSAQRMSPRFLSTIKIDEPYDITFKGNFQENEISITLKSPTKSPPPLLFNAVPCSPLWHGDLISFNELQTIFNQL